MHAFSPLQVRAVLDRYGTIPALIISKSHSTSADEHLGPQASLHHSIWKLQTADPEKTRRAAKWVNFEQPIHTGGLILTDERFSADLLTAKILALESVTGDILPRVTAATARDRFLWLSWILRLRLELDIGGNNLIDSHFFQHYCDLMKRGGTIGLIPLADRLATLERRLQTGDWTWPTYTLDRRPMLHVRAVASELGIPTAALLRPQAKARVQELFMSTSTGIHWRSMDKMDDAPEGDEYRQLTEEKTFQVLQTWQVLFRLTILGRLDHDPLTFDPFATVSMKSRAKQIGGKPTQRTKTMDAEQWLALLDGAAFWVLDLSYPLRAIIIKAKRIYRRLFRRNDGKLSPERKALFAREVQALIDLHLPCGSAGTPRLLPRWRRSAVDEQGQAGLPLDEAMAMLITAAIILKGGISARRANELMSLPSGCTYQDAFGNHWLSSYVEKTLRDIDQFPIPSSLHFTARLMTRISSATRLRTGKNWLFEVSRPSFSAIRTGHGFLDLSLPARINDFAKIVGVPLSPGASSHQFETRQLRRAHAIFYYHGYRYSNLDALSRFFGHYDPEMTRIYVNSILTGEMARMVDEIKARISEANKTCDPSDFITEADLDQACGDALERAAIFEEVRREAVVDRLLRIYDKAEDPSGLGAPRLLSDLNQLIADARRAVRVDGRSNVPPDRERSSLVDRLKKAATIIYLEPHPGKHVHCSCRPKVSEDLQKAACLIKKRASTGLSDDIIADYAHSSILDCLSCPFAVVFSENRARIDQEVVALTATSSSPSTSISANAVHQKLEQMKLAILGSAQAS